MKVKISLASLDIHIEEILKNFYLWLLCYFMKNNFYDSSVTVVHAAFLQGFEKSDLKYGNTKI